MNVVVKQGYIILGFKTLDLSFTFSLQRLPTYNSLHRVPVLRT